VVTVRTLGVGNYCYVASVRRRARPLGAHGGGEGGSVTITREPFPRMPLYKQLETGISFSRTWPAAAGEESTSKISGTCLIPSTEGVASATHVSPVTCNSNNSTH